LAVRGVLDDILGLLDGEAPQTVTFGRRFSPADEVALEAAAPREAAPQVTVLQRVPREATPPTANPRMAK
jgi:hypothetical protein